MKASGSPPSAVVSIYPTHNPSIVPRMEVQPHPRPLPTLNQSPTTLQKPLHSQPHAARIPSPLKEETVKAAIPSHYTFQGAPGSQAVGHCSPMFVCIESSTSLSQPCKSGNEDTFSGRRATEGMVGGSGSNRKGAFSPDAFQVELLRTKQNPMFSMSSSPVHVTEEFIDDDPTEISFYGGGAEAFPFRLDDKVHQYDYVEESDLGKNRLFSVGIEDLNRSSNRFPDGIVGHSDTSSLVNNRSECSSLDNLGLSSAGESMSVGYGGHDSSSLRLPGSGIHSEASSMVNFPAYSVRSESSSAVQFSDLVEQLEQLSYPPTATEGSGNGESDSDSDWGSDSVLPPEQNLFCSNPLTGSSGLENFILQCQNLQALALADISGSSQM